MRDILAPHIKRGRALVTGGTGGIGSIAVESLLKKGSQVAIFSRRARLPGNLKPYSKKEGNLLNIKCDITDHAQVKRTIGKVIDQFGKLDVVINAAGIQGPFGKSWETDPGEWAKNYTTNVFGIFLIMKEVIPFMIKNNKGKIINLSGGGSTGPRERLSAYAASKAALIRLTETVAKELSSAGYPIDVNAVAPGSVLTSMTKEILANKNRVGAIEYDEALNTEQTGGTSKELLLEFFDFLISPESDGLSGKLISALWDDWRKFPGQYVELNKSSLYTLRRIDGRSYYEKHSLDNE